jgi:hypothetical protein
MTFNLINEVWIRNEERNTIVCEDISLYQLINKVHDTLIKNKPFDELRFHFEDMETGEIYEIECLINEKYETKFFKTKYCPMDNNIFQQLIEISQNVFLNKLKNYL